MVRLPLNSRSAPYPSSVQSHRPVGSVPTMLLYVGVSTMKLKPQRSFLPRQIRIECLYLCHRSSVHTSSHHHRSFFFSPPVSLPCLRPCSHLSLATIPVVLTAIWYTPDCLIRVVVPNSFMIQCLPLLPLPHPSLVCVIRDVGKVSSPI